MLQRPPYHNFDDRLDRIAQAADASVADVIAANPAWVYNSEHPTGSAYLPNARAPAPGSAAAPREETLSPRLAAIKAEWDGAGYEGDPEEYLQSVVEGYDPAGQMKSDMSGIEDNLEVAAFWDAQVRAATPRGMLWGAPELGTDLLEYALIPSRAITPALLAGAAAIARQAMRRNPGWYSSEAMARYQPETAMRLLASIGVPIPPESS